MLAGARRATCSHDKYLNDFAARDQVAKSGQKVAPYIEEALPDDWRKRLAAGLAA
jgi:hypothetical protein